MSLIEKHHLSTFKYFQLMVNSGVSMTLDVQLTALPRVIVSGCGGGGLSHKSDGGGDCGKF